MEPLKAILAVAEEINQASLEAGVDPVEAARRFGIDASVIIPLVPREAREEVAEGGVVSLLEALMWAAQALAALEV